MTDSIENEFSAKHLKLMAELEVVCFAKNILELPMCENIY